MHDVAGVRYVGRSDVRIVDGFAMQAVGVSPAEHDLVWAGHGAVAPANRLSAGIVDYLLTNHGDEFELVLKDDGAP